MIDVLDSCVKPVPTDSAVLGSHGNRGRAQAEGEGAERDPIPIAGRHIFSCSSFMVSTVPRRCCQFTAPGGGRGSGRAAQGVLRLIGRTAFAINDARLDMDGCRGAAARVRPVLVISAATATPRADRPGAADEQAVPYAWCSTLLERRCGAAALAQADTGLASAA
jgi:hypothetical protein